MSRLLVDSSAYSAFMAGHPEARGALQRADEIYVNAIILGEVLTGFMRGRHRRKNEQELEAFLASPRVRVLNVDAETSDRYAVMVNGLWEAETPIPTNDIWIAATAMQHGLRVVTLDAHYRKVPQIIVDSLQTG